MVETTKLAFFAYFFCLWNLHHISVRQFSSHAFALYNKPFQLICKYLLSFEDFGLRPSVGLAWYLGFLTPVYNLVPHQRIPSQFGPSSQNSVTVQGYSEFRHRNCKSLIEFSSHWKKKKNCENIHPHPVFLYRNIKTFIGLIRDTNLKLLRSIYNLDGLFQVRPVANFMPW